MDGAEAEPLAVAAQMDDPLDGALVDLDLAVFELLLLFVGEWAKAGGELGGKDRRFLTLRIARDRPQQHRPRMSVDVLAIVARGDYRRVGGHRPQKGD